MNYAKKEGISTFAKMMIGLSLIIVAIIVTVVITMSGSVGTATTTPANLINNALQFVKDGTLEKHKATELDTFEAVPETVEEGQTVLTIFADYACPHCQTFEEATGNEIDTMLNSGDITELRIAPVSYQPTPYAMLSHMSILCIADMEPEKAFTAHKTLMTIGAEGGTDFTTLMSKIGTATGSDLTNDTKLCIKNNKFRNYADLQNLSANSGGFWPLTAGGITGTPSVFINEQKYSGQPDPAALALAINWVKAGGNLQELENNPALADTLDLSNPAEPKIVTEDTE